MVRRRQRRRPMLGAAWTGLDGLEARSLLSAPFGYQTVALVGQTAPGTGGSTFLGFTDAGSYPPSISEDGRVALASSINQGIGIWQGPPGCVHLVAFGGEPSAALGGAYAPRFDFFTMTDTGEVGSRNSDGALTTQSVWIDADGKDTLIAKIGDLAPGTGGAQFSSFSPIFNAGGRVAFIAGLTGNGVDSTNAAGLWAGDASGVTLVLRDGEAAPQGGNQRFYGSLNLSGNIFAMNRHGDLAFFESAGEPVPLNPGVFANTNVGVWVKDNLGLRLLIQQNTSFSNGGNGTVAGGTNGGKFIGGTNLLGYNQFGHLLLQGGAIHEIPNQPSEVFSGIWFADKFAASQPVVLANQNVPPLSFGVPAWANAKFRGGGLATNSSVLGNDGRVYFQDYVWDGFANVGLGVFAWKQGAMQLVIRQGQQVPDAPAGVTFGDLQGGIQANGQGEIAFLAHMNGPNPGDESVGLLAMDKAGALHLLARTRTGFEVSPGVSQQVLWINFGSSSPMPVASDRSGGGDGRASPLNERGQVVFSIDGGTFIANLDSAPPGIIGDLVFNDLNGNGIQDAGETGMPGIHVQLANLQNPGQPPFLDTTTDEDGHFCFSGLDAGDYYLRFMPGTDPAFAFSPRNQGNDPALDSDAFATGQAIGLTDTFHLNPDQSDLTRDAGLQVAVTIGGRVFDDFDRDGIFGNTEAGIGSIAVQLYKSSDNSVGNDQLAASTTTDPAGSFRFDNLTAGSYYVKFVAPTGIRFTLQGPGSNPTVSSDADADGITPLFLAGIDAADDLLHNAGMYRPTQLGDFVWRDLNGNGLQDTGEPGFALMRLLIRSGDYSSTVETDAAGHYRFYDPPPGDVDVVVDIPDAYTWTSASQGADRSHDSEDVILYGLPGVPIEQFQFTAHVDRLPVLPAPAADDPSLWYDVGLVSADGIKGKVSLGTKVAADALVFDDANNNGQLDAGEAAARAGSDGLYELHVAIGQHHIVVQAGGKSATQAVVVPVSGGLVKLNLTLPPATALASDLSLAKSGTLPKQVVMGETMSAQVLLKNLGKAAFGGDINVELFASRDKALEANWDSLLHLAASTLTLTVNGSRKLIFQFAVPSNMLPGLHNILARVRPAAGEETNSTNNLISLGQTRFDTPVADLSPEFVSVPSTLKPGKQVTLSFNVRNRGNFRTAGTAALTLLASGDAVLGGDTTLAAKQVILDLLAGKTVRVSVTFTVPTAAQGLSYLLVELTPPDDLLDTNTQDKLIKKATKFR